MSELRVLLIAKETSEARLIIRTIENITLRIPMHLTNADAAIDWIIGNACDLCLLDDSLPKMDPLELVARIHQRRPDLSIIMLSRDQSAQAAIAAFHGGVIDYVIKQRDFHTVITRHLQQYVQKSTANSTPSPMLNLGSLPEQLGQPTYQNRLRVIGRQLDIYGYHAINLLEVSGGFLVRALIAGNRTPQALEFSDRDFPQLVSNAFSQRGEKQHARSKSELLPTGYEDFLRALGYRLDMQMAEAITVAELERFVVVGGVALVEGAGQQVLEPFQGFLQPDDIMRMVNEAVRRRSAQPQPELTLFTRLTAR